MRIRDLFKNVLAVLACVLPLALHAANPPQVGGAAPNFTLTTLDDKKVSLSDLTSSGNVVLVELRGWVGYTCPFCTKQVNDFVRDAAKFKAAGVQVLFVYPGPSDELKAHAAKFLADKSWPADFQFVLDPDYEFTKAYGLRWEAKGETAYPSTFIIDAGNKVRFAHISKAHGNRVGAPEVLKVLAEIK